MSCYSPLYVVYNNGEFARFGGKLTTEKLNAAQDGQQYVPVPCGKCVGCRMDRSRKWADRMLLEFSTERDDMPSKTALFLTLTYDDDHLERVLCTDGAYRGTLVKKHPVDFLKRLRKYFEPRRIRFFSAGEYGDKTFRPHYHMILFGLSLADFPDSYLYSHDSEMDTDLYESPKLDRIWSKGAVRFSVASYATFAYVSRYVLKKQFVSDLGALYYKGRLPPFNHSSRNPGLGSDFFDNFADAERRRKNFLEFSPGLDPLDLTRVSISDGDRVHEISMPRCVFEKKCLTNPEKGDIIKTQRMRVAAAQRDLIESQTDLDWLDYLKVQQRTFESRVNILKERSKV